MSSDLILQLGKNEQMDLEYVKKKGFIKRADCQKLIGVNEIQARYILRKMSDGRLLRKEGQRRGSKYLLA